MHLCFLRDLNTHVVSSVWRIFSKTPNPVQRHSGSFRDILASGTLSSHVSHLPPAFSLSYCLHCALFVCCEANWDKRLHAAFSSVCFSVAYVIKKENQKGLQGHLTSPLPVMSSSPEWHNVVMSAVHIDDLHGHHHMQHVSHSVLWAPLFIVTLFFHNHITTVTAAVKPPLYLSSSCILCAVTLLLILFDWSYFKSINWSKMSKNHF